MRSRAPLFVLLPLTVVGLGACSQPWNSNAADDVKNAVEPNEHEHSRHVDTPVIEISSGTGIITTDPCERLRFQLLNEDEGAGPMGILAHECALQCHTRENPQQGLSILDVAALVDPGNTAPNGSACGAGKNYIVPGDPDNSCIFRRMADGQMPPLNAAQTFAGTPEKIPWLLPASTSEASMVYSWIAGCLGAQQVAPAGPGGGA